jgi:hypothetical protein
MTKRRTLVAYGALPMVQAGRHVELAALPALARVAVLAEAAGAFAAMARRQARRNHVSPADVALLVTDPADAMAVLGRGRWLPTMQRPILAPPNQLRQTRRRTTAAIPAPGQLDLFSDNDSHSRRKGR